MIWISKKEAHLRNENAGLREMLRGMRSGHEAERQRLIAERDELQELLTKERDFSARFRDLAARRTEDVNRLEEGMETNVRSIGSAMADRVSMTALLAMCRTVIDSRTETGPDIIAALLTGYSDAKEKTSE